MPQPKTWPSRPSQTPSLSTSQTGVNGNASAPVAACKTFHRFVGQLRAIDAATSSTESAASPEQPTAAKPSTEPASNSKLMLGDLELRATEAVSGEGTRQSDSKYFHVFQNGSCYEFALNVTTDASEEGLVKHVDRDKVFTRLEQILATVKIDAVKINPVAPPEVSAETPAPTPTATPAQ